MMNTYGHAEFDIDYVTTERSDKHKYVIRTDTDECIGMVNSTYTGTSHPDYFGKMREQWMNTLQPEKFGAWVKKLVNQRHQLRTLQQDTIQLDPEISRIFNNSTATSGRYFQQFSMFR